MEKEEKVTLDVGSGYTKHSNGCYTLDFDPKVKPDIVGDIQALPIKSEAIDTIICNAVLEHIPEPQQAVNELHRILRKGGKLLTYTAFLYPYHGNSRYGDYFRFTRDGTRYLFRHFDQVETTAIRKLFGVIYLLIPFGKKSSLITKFLDRAFFSNKEPNITSGYSIVASKFKEKR